MRLAYVSVKKRVRVRENIHETPPDESNFAPFNNTPFIPFHFIDVRHVANVKLRAGIKSSSINTCLMRKKTTHSFLLLSQEQYPIYFINHHK